MIFNQKLNLKMIFNQNLNQKNQPQNDIQPKPQSKIQPQNDNQSKNQIPDQIPKINFKQQIVVMESNEEFEDDTPKSEIVTKSSPEKSEKEPPVIASKKDSQKQNSIIIGEEPESDDEMQSKLKNRSKTLSAINEKSLTYDTHTNNFQSTYNPFFEISKILVIPSSSDIGWRSDVMDKTQAENMLSGKEPGTFLVRWSTAIYCYVVSYVSKLNAQINHIAYIFPGMNTEEIGVQKVDGTFNYFSSLSDYIQSLKYANLIKSPVDPENRKTKIEFLEKQALQLEKDKAEKREKEKKRR